MKTTTDSNSLYSGIAKFYDIGLWLTGYKLAVPYFLNLLPFNRDASLRVLDAGCGTGLYTFAILKKFRNAQMTAFDVNAAMMEKMKRIVQEKGLDSRVQIFNWDITGALPLPEKQFDLIVTGGGLEYINDPAAAVKNLSPYLKKGGYFLNSPVKDNWLARMVAKFYKFTPHSSLTNISAFTHNGFTLERTRSFPIIKEAHLFKKL